jgi:hypothetical protein
VTFVVRCCGWFSDGAAGVVGLYEAAEDEEEEEQVNSDSNTDEYVVDGLLFVPHGWMLLDAVAFAVHVDASSNDDDTNGGASFATYFAVRAVP